MAYSFKNSKGQTYFLHATTRTLKSGKQQHLYFFAKTVKTVIAISFCHSRPQGKLRWESTNSLI